MSKKSHPPALDRRQLGRLIGGSIAAAGLASVIGCRKPATDEAPIGANRAPPSNATLIRVASVPTAVEGNVLPELIKAFEKQSTYKVELVSNPQLYDSAREGKVDLAISHYGHRDAETFVLDGLGEWPRTIFSNQMALLGPSSDPAQIRGLEDVGEAFRRIAATKSKYVLNEIEGVRYLTNILWNAAGRPDRTGWWLEPNASKDGAIKQASDLGAYSLWGLTPFLRLHGATPTKLEPLVLGDPLLQRMMVSIVVKSGGIRAVNVVGATALQTYLLEPGTQARIRTIRYPGTNVVTWVPAGRHNRTAMLPKG